MEEGYLDVNGIRLHYVSQGQGPLALFLHGFPEFWYSWHHQLPVMAEAGYRAVAIDMRGYNLSDKPKGKSAYRLSVILDDIKEVIEQLGDGQCILVGHDFGGLLSWSFAMQHPELLTKLVVLNAPHPYLYACRVFSWKQMFKSFYVVIHKLPIIPGLIWRFCDYWMLRMVLRYDPVRKDAFSREDIARYKEALSKPGALTSALNYYRAASLFEQRRTSANDVPRIPTHTLVIWGEQDRYLSADILLHELEEFVPNVHIERLSHASHWVQSDAPQDVNTLLLDFLST